MDWDMKMHPWDMGELDRDADPSLGSLVRPSTSLGHHTSPSDCSVDLKLGGLGDFGFSGKWKDQNSFSMTMVTSSSSSAMASPSGSSKRTRAVSNGIQNASCLVDGCKSDLSNCREYHRRHKVCEVHSKTPVVMVNGQEQRFCQQCSRFHLLVEFDEVKRSCRKRLDGHNRRRRKPQPDPLSAGSLFVSHQGPRFSTYSQIFPTTTEPHWATVVKTEEDVLFGHNLSSRLVERPEHFTGSSSHGYKEAKQFPFLQESDSTYGNRAIETSVHPLLSTMASSESSNRKMYSNGLTQVPESDCALSLLSSPTQTSGINLGHMLSADRIPMGQPLVSSLQQYGGLSRYSRSHALNNVSPTGFSCSGMDDAEVGTVMVSDPSDAGLQYQGIFHVGADGTSNETSQAIPFSWQ
uniref:Squamosa promoter-binding-like protein 16 n=1 Tax=Anthurium amnicola TaxID=1678845 RepID=A0A1D1Y8E3_9ARAE